MVRGRGRGRDPGERTAARGHRGLVRHGPRHARLQQRRDRPDAVRLVSRRRHGRARAPAGTVPFLLALAAVGQRVGAVPAGAARPPAAAARAGRALLGRVGGPAAANRSDRTARGSAPPVHHLVHGGHELPADARGRAGARRPERIRQDRARDRHHAAERAGGPGVPVARDLPLARGDLVRARPQRPLVPRALDVPAGRRRRLRSSGRCCCSTLPARCPVPSRRTCRVSPSAGTRSGGSGSSRSRNGTASWPRNAAQPPWSAGSPRSSGAGSSGPGRARGAGSRP